MIFYCFKNLKRNGCVNAMRTMQSVSHRPIKTLILGMVVLAFCLLMSEQTFAESVGSVKDIGKPVSHGQDLLVDVVKKSIVPFICIVGALFIGFYLFYKDYKSAFTSFASTTIAAGVLLTAKLISQKITGS